MCPPGRTDFLCATAMLQKCALQITDPDFVTGCPNNPDSAYYTYSLLGYAPCYFLDFTSTYSVEFYVKCMYYDAPTANAVQSKTPRLGY